MRQRPEIPAGAVRNALHGGRCAARAARRAASLVALVTLAAAAAGGCGGAHRQATAPAASAAEWKWLEENRAHLAELRAQRAALGEAPEGEPVSGGAGGASGAGGVAATAAGLSGPAGPAGQRQALERQIDALGKELDRRLVAYINADPPLEGTPLSPPQLAAIRMKSDEEIAVAHLAIGRTGDYRRAIEIYEAALAGDPQNQRLQQELVRAREERFMTAERFSRVASGMTADQVRDALGRPNSHDVRVYPDRGVVGWFYARDPSGSAAAVWFERHPLDGGQLTAYLCDWNAVPPAQPAAPRAPAAKRPVPVPAAVPES